MEESTRSGIVPVEFGTRMKIHYLGNAHGVSADLYMRHVPCSVHTHFCQGLDTTE